MCYPPRLSVAPVWEEVLEVRNRQQPSSQRFGWSIVELHFSQLVMFKRYARREAIIPGKDCLVCGGEVFWELSCRRSATAGMGVGQV